MPAGRAEELREIGSPAVQVGRYMAAAKLAGEDFESAWVRALDGVLWPTDGVERRQWKEALAWSREKWRAYYNGEGSKRLGVAFEWLIERLTTEEPSEREDLELVA